IAPQRRAALLIGDASGGAASVQFLVDAPDFLDHPLHGHGAAKGAERPLHQGRHQNRWHGDSLPVTASVSPEMVAFSRLGIYRCALSPKDIIHSPYRAQSARVSIVETISSAK